jgi:IS1 family transposase
MSAVRQTPKWPSPLSLPALFATFTEPHTKTLGEMYISREKAALITRLLVEGNSVRSTERISGVDRNTIMKVLVLAGEKCEKLLGRTIVKVPVRDVECDEIWAFVGKKEKQLQPGDDPNFGDAYCFVAIERNTKLVLNFALGKRDQRTTNAFIEGLRHATSGKFQITSVVTPKPAIRGHLKTGHRESGRTTVVITRPMVAGQGLMLAASERPEGAIPSASAGCVNGASSPDLWECGNRACDFQARWKSRETCSWFSEFSRAHHFHQVTPLR